MDGWMDGWIHGKKKNGRCSHAACCVSTLHNQLVTREESAYARLQIFMPYTLQYIQPDDFGFGFCMLHTFHGSSDIRIPPPPPPAFQSIPAPPRLQYFSSMHHTDHASSVDSCFPLCPRCSTPSRSPLCPVLFTPLLNASCSYPTHAYPSPLRLLPCPVTPWPYDPLAPPITGWEGGSVTGGL